MKNVFELAQFSVLRLTTTHPAKNMDGLGFMCHTVPFTAYAILKFGLCQQFVSKFPLTRKQPAGRKGRGENVVRLVSSLMTSAASRC